jgi:hypothetical protein
VKLLNSFLLICLVFSFGSCQPIMLAVYGIQKPKVTSEQKILKAMESQNLNCDYSFSISESGFFRYIDLPYSVNRVFLYTKNGKYISKLDSSDCSSSTTGFLNVFKEPAYSEELDLDTTNYFNDYFVKMDGSKVTLNLNTQYYAVVFWATFSGRLNEKSSEWANYLIKDPGVKVICVSLDPREFWPSAISK